jgi:hypothetical protein
MIFSTKYESVPFADQKTKSVERAIRTTLEFRFKGFVKDVDVLGRVTTPSLIEYASFICAGAGTPKKTEPYDVIISDTFDG